MSARQPRATAQQQRVDSAMHWLVRLRHSEISGREVLAWLAWYEHDDDNRRVFDEIQELWRLSGKLSLEQQGRVEIEALQRCSAWDRWRWRCEAWFADRFGKSDAGVPCAQRPAFRWAPGMAAAAVLAALLLASALGYRDLRRESTRMASTVALVRVSTLPDESRVELAPQTTIAVTYSPAERRLDMSAGEADFVVTPNKKRPFVVHLDTLRVRAVGTQFDIRRAADRVVVTVIEGSIDVYREGTHAQRASVADISTGDALAGGQVAHVLAGQQFTVLQDGGHDSLNAADSAGALDWREGRLRYVDEPLAAVIADVNRYVTRPVVIRGDRLKKLTYTGTIFIQSIDEWLSAIPQEFPLVVVTEANQTVLVPASDNEESTIRNSEE